MKQNRSRRRRESGGSLLVILLMLNIVAAIGHRFIADLGWLWGLVATNVWLFICFAGIGIVHRPRRQP